MASSGFEEGLARFVSASRRVAEGDYKGADALFELTDSRVWPRAISEMAEAFGMMIVKVEAREFQLQNTVEELTRTRDALEEARRQLARENRDLKEAVGRLTIEIDQQKKKRDVAAITESDFFRGLQEKVREIREEKQDREG